MADDNDNNSSEKEKESVNYVRKKNIIPGFDNDHLILAGLGLLAAITAAPYAKQALDSLLRNLPQNQQIPPNGIQQQQPVYLPPTTQAPQVPQHVPEHVHEHEQENLLSEHERNMKDQQAYEAAAEKESVTGASSFSMVPDRSTQVASNKNKNKGNYEAGSNISGSYS